MFITRREYERLCDEISEWRAKYEEARFSSRRAWETAANLQADREKFFLDEYEYAVMLPKDKSYLRVWNNGRFEDGVKQIELSQEAGYVPYLKMIK